MFVFFSTQQNLRVGVRYKLLYQVLSNSYSSTIIMELTQPSGQLPISVIYAITYFNQYHEALFFFPNGYCCGLNVNIFQVCRKCGLLGYYNHKLKTSYCSMCKNGKNMAKMRLPYACKLLFQVLHKSIMYCCFNHRT